MGRTVPSYRIALEEEIKTWEGFRKALRMDDAEAFEQMMNACRSHASAAGSATRTDILEAMFMSILLSQQKDMMEIKKEIAELKKRLSNQKI